MEDGDEQLLINNDITFISGTDSLTETEVNQSGNYDIYDRDLLSDTASTELNASSELNRRTKRWDLNYHEAAIYLQEGENNDKFTSHPKSQDALPAYLITHNTWFYLLDLVASLLLMSLALIERPAVFSVHIGIHGSLELLCLLIITLELGMRLKWLGFQPFLRHWRTMIKSVCLLIMIIEAITVLARQASHVRITRSIRPLFLLDCYYLRSVRRFTRQLIQSLPAIFDMLVLLLFFMLLFSILGFYLFSDIPNDQYFQSIQDSFVNMFVLLTTANFPDIMMSCYAYNRWSAMFFITYLSIELYLFMNLFLAVVYDAFQKIEKEKLKNLLLHKREACQHAFKLLVSKQNPNSICLTQFEGLMKYYNKKISRRDVYLTFKSLNVAKTGKLSLKEFYEIYTYHTLKWKKKVFQHHVWSSSFRFPLNKIFKALYKLVTNKWFEYFIYFIIIANFLWIVSDTIDISVENITHNAPTWIRTIHKYVWCSSIFVAIYVIEAILKILGLGPRKYFQSGWNVFDFLVTAISAVGVLFEFLNQTFYYFLICRPLRLLRLFKLKRRYRDVLGTIFILSSRLLSISIVILVVYYFFAIIGMEIFSHHDMRNCCVNTTVEMYYKYDNVTGTYGYYYLNNFENVLMTGVTLFEMTVVNNWYIIMDGYAAVFTDWSRIFFMLFYIVTMVIMTVVVSFVLESFLFRIQYRTAMHGHDLDDDAIMKIDVSLQQHELTMCADKSIPLVSVMSNQNITSPDTTDPSDMIWFRGERLRSKNDFNVIMYKREVQEWINHENQQQLEEEENMVQEMISQPDVC